MLLGAQRVIKCAVAYEVVRSADAAVAGVTESGGHGREDRRKPARPPSRASAAPPRPDHGRGPVGGFTAMAQSGPAGMGAAGMALGEAGVHATHAFSMVAGPAAVATPARPRRPPRHDQRGHIGRPPTCPAYGYEHFHKYPDRRLRLPRQIQFRGGFVHESWLPVSEARISKVPIIDLDHVQTVPTRPSPRRLPVLIALAAGSLLFGLTGEPQGSAGPAGEANVCSSFGPSDGSSEETIIFNAAHVEIRRIPQCSA
jgi:hypothetical protein